ncbi:hypothetical protein J3R30DRAFT_3419761 [Lentinula aciculospora]|uniref:DUF6593 domain-containing protein n=1 Tax=Lentinula aciculospora TaxID=153920 RepID=A0A9W9ATG7_9AGAR|nr:hypothetical protein J3R30DRAFT_3419761 [Lentinula aciculospora]
MNYRQNDERKRNVRFPSRPFPKRFAGSSSFCTPPPLFIFPLSHPSSQSLLLLTDDLVLFNNPADPMASSMLHFTQTTKDPHNTEFTLNPDGPLTIKVYTELPLKEFTANTTIVDVVIMDQVMAMNDSIMLMSGRPKPKSSEGPILHHQRVERVGEMDFYTFSERTPKVRLRGREAECNMPEYLERIGYGKKRRFIASSGCAYTWVDFRLKLDDKREVGRYYPRKSKGLFGAKQPAYLELERERIADIGDIGFTLVCMLHESGKHAHVHV